MIPFQISFQDLKTWVRFSGLKFWGRDLKIFKEKVTKNFKVLKLSKIVPKCPNVFWGDFFENCFLPSVQWSHPKISKKSKKNKNCKKAQNRFQNCPKLFWTCFAAIFFEKNLPRATWRVGPSKNFKKIKKVSKFKKCPKSFPKVSERVLNMFGAIFSNFVLPRGPCGAFQILWT